MNAGRGGDNPLPMTGLIATMSRKQIDAAIASEMKLDHVAMGPASTQELITALNKIVPDSGVIDTFIDTKPGSGDVIEGYGG